MEGATLRWILFCACIVLIQSYSHFRDRIPNGDRVPDPCRVNYVWKGVGHKNINGGGVRNPFGLAFAANGFQWNRAICEADSDNDGRTNGQELGDPDCTWQHGHPAPVQYNTSHPGICEPMEAAHCQQRNDWDFCVNREFNCPAINAPDVQVKTVRFPPTAIPPTETNYYCMPFDLELPDEEYHLIATKPYIDNEHVLHHIVIMGCHDTNAELTPSPQPCAMIQHKMGCGAIIGVWTLGLLGECHDDHLGFKIGRGGYTRIAFQFHWNNPQLLHNYVDSSGITLYYTRNLRPNNANTFLLGQEFMAIPPNQQNHTEIGVCSEYCSHLILKGPIFFSATVNHMHYLGVGAKIDQYRNGRYLRTFADEPEYSYDAPIPFKFRPNIAYQQGDELRFVCNFKSVGRGRTVYYGDGTPDEMCYSFLTYYPAENVINPSCIQWRDVDYCEHSDPQGAFLGPNRECPFNDFYRHDNPHTPTLHAHLQSRCDPFMCKEGCKEMVDLLRAQEPCLRGNVGDYGAMAKRGDRDWLDFHAALRSCDKH